MKTLFRNGILVYLGSILNAGLTFVASILLARALGTESYGLFTTAVAILFLVNELTDLGINPSVIRYAAQYLQDGNREKAQTAFRFALRSRALFSTLLVVLGWLFAKPIAIHFFHLETLAPLLRIAFLGVLPLVGISYFTTIFQSEEKFGKQITVSILGGASKLLAVIWLLLAHKENPALALTVFSAAPVIALTYAFLITDHDLLKTPTYHHDVARELRSFSSWMAIWALFAILQGRLDQFMVVRYLGSAAAGTYAAAYQLAILFTFLVSAIGTVLNPRLAGMKKDELKRMFKKFPLFAGGVLCVIAILLAVGLIAVPILFGSTYLAARPVYTALMIGLIFFGWSTLPNATLNAIKRPYIFSITAITGLILTFLLNLVFLPMYGVIGAAYTFTIVNALSFIISIAAANYYLNHAE